MTHTPPSEYLDDPIMYAAFRDEAEAASWTDLHELLALNAEIGHAALRQSMAAAGAKGSDLPKALKIPRPNAPKPVAVSPIEAAMQMRAG